MRVLIVSPHFPPTNAADMQRVRLILPYLRECGVEAEVLCVEPEQVASPVDAWLEAGLALDVPVHRVRALGLGWGRLPGMGTLTFRALGAIRRKGDELLGKSKGQRAERKEEEEENGEQRAERKAEENEEGYTEGKPERLSSSSLGASRLALSSSLALPSTGFDLVYFSTTQFGVHVLGPRWKRKFGVPFVMDYQDPWVSDYYREHPGVVPPGGRLKYAIASWMSRRQEPRVLRHCSGITSVSAAYPVALQARYPWLAVEEQRAKREAQSGEIGEQSAKCKVQSEEAGAASQNLPPSASPFELRSLPALVLPFPGDVRDFERVKAEDVRQSVFDPNDGLRHWVYVGRGGDDMATACRALFAGIAGAMQSAKSEGRRAKRKEQRVRDGEADSSLPLCPLPFALCSDGTSLPLCASPFVLSSLRLHFIGTSYAAAGRGTKTIEPLAAEYGLESLVVEHPDRIPYSETLRCLLDADALIVPGSDDPGYTASKIYPYLLAEKPLLAVFHEQSSVVELIRQVGGGTVIPFSTDESIDAIAARISSEWLASGAAEVAVPIDRKAFAPHTARAQAERLAQFWMLNGRKFHRQDAKDAKGR